MKRNPDLERKILLAVEGLDWPAGSDGPLSVDGYPENEVSFHLNLLVDARFVISREGDGSRESVLPDRLTMDGFEYLEHVRDPELWNRTIKAADRIGSRSLYVLDRISRRLLDERIDRLVRPESTSWTVI